MSDNLLPKINVLKMFSFWNQWNQCRLISRAFTVMVEGSIQHAVDDGRSMACSPCVGRRIFYACLSRAPRLGLSAVFGLPSNRGRSSRQCMASGIRKSFLRVRTWISVQISMPGRQTERTQVWELIASLAHPSNCFH